MFIKESDASAPEKTPIYSVSVCDAIFTDAKVQMNFIALFVLKCTNELTYEAHNM